MALNLKALLSADSRGFVTGVERAERELEELGQSSSKTNKKIETNNKKTGASFNVLKGAISGALAALSVGAITAGVSGIVRANAEVNLLSASLNISKDALYSWGKLGEKAGLDIADVFKDASEKIADFATTGGGEAGDVFKRLKLDVNELIALSPDQQVLKIVSAMDELKDVSQGEKIFLMESLANDASKLLPLLESNAQKLREIDQVARASGALVNAEQNEILEQAGHYLDLIGIAFDGAGNAAGVAGAKFLNAFGPELVDAISGIDDWIFRQSVNIETLAAVWSDAWDLMGMDTDGFTEYVGELIDDLFEGLRLALTYAPIWAKAAWDAAGAYTESWVAYDKALFEQSSAAAKRMFAFIVEYAGLSFGQLPNLAGQAVGLILERFASMADGVSDALGLLDNVPGFEGMASGAASAAQQLRSLSAGAKSAGRIVIDTAKDMADSIRDSAKESDAAAEALYAQSDAAAQVASDAIAGAVAYQENAEAERELTLAMREAEKQFEALGSSVDKSSAKQKKFFVNQDAVNKALTDGSKAGKTAKDAVDKLAQAQESELASLRDVALQLANTGEGYYAASLRVKQFEKDVRAEAEALHYRNTLTAEQQRLDKAGRSTSSTTDQYRASLQDVGLKAPDVDDLVSKDLLNRFNDLQFAVGLAGKKAKLSEQESRALELRLVNGLNPAMASTVAAGEARNKQSEEAKDKAEELASTQTEELKALRDTALELANTGEGYYSASLQAKNFEKGVRAEAEALHYRNTLTAEQQRLDKAGRSTSSTTDQYRASLQDVGLKAPDVDSLVSKDLLNRFNELQFAIGLAGQKAKLSEQESRALELRLVNGLSPAMASTVALGEARNKQSAEATAKAKELQKAQSDELKALRDTALQLSTTGEGYYSATLKAKNFEDGVRKEAEALHYRNTVEAERQRLDNEARDQAGSVTDDYRNSLIDQGVKGPELDYLVNKDLKNRMDELAASTNDVMQKAKLSKVAYREWQLVVQRGFSPAAAEAQVALDKQAEQMTESRELADDLSNTLKGDVIDSLQSMVDTGNDLLDTLINKFLEAALSADSLSGFLSAFTGGGGGSSGGGIGGLITSGLSSLFGFAQGGSFEVGGSGGTDSQLVAFKASPNERVTIETPEQQNAKSSGSSVSVSTPVYVNIQNAPAGTTVSETETDEAKIINVMLGQVQNSGQVMQAMEFKYPSMKRAGI